MNDDIEIYDSRAHGPNAAWFRVEAGWGRGAVLLKSWAEGGGTCTVGINREDAARLADWLNGWLEEDRCECGHWMQPVCDSEPDRCVMGCTFQRDRDREWLKEDEDDDE